MGYIIAYLLFAVAVDLLLELVAPKSSRPPSIASHRRLWNDSLFDCRSRVFSMDGGTFRRSCSLSGPVETSLAGKSIKMKPEYCKATS